MAEQNLPAPLVPAEVDLRGYEYMPLDVVRLMRSSSWRKIRRQPELGYWSLNLWASSWHEVPASSLPNDDDELADFARCDLKKWGKVRGLVLAGWIKCSDGRLYHPVVAEKALEAWAKMSLQRKRTQAAREALKQKLSQKPSSELVTPPVTDSLTASKGEEKRRTEQRREDPPLAEASPVKPAREDTAAATGGQQSPPQKPQAVDPQAKGDDQLAFPAGLDRTVDRAFADWNARSVEHGWPQAQMLNSTRRWAIQQRLGECGGLEGWRAALDAASTSEFITGTDGKPQRWFDLDWLIKPENFTRLMEGRYAERHRTDAKLSGTDAIAAFAKAGSR